jgi:hypothetical protein
LQRDRRINSDPDRIHTSASGLFTTGRKTLGNRGIDAAKLDGTASWFLVIFDALDDRTMPCMFEFLRNQPVATASFREAALKSFRQKTFAAVTAKHVVRLLQPGTEVLPDHDKNLIVCDNRQVSFHMRFFV